MSQAHAVASAGAVADVSRPQLTDRQQNAVLRAASEMLAAAAHGRQVVLSDPELAGAADLPVLGCFVSIKRKGRLRGCCGFLGRRARLVAALQESAISSAVEDVRMPPVSPSELPYLELEVWLLYGQQAVQGSGPEREQAVTIGEHGLVVQHGTARGLLLPGVATDNHWDAEQFLQQVCLKAGLPPTAWREDEVQLATFEGVLLDGPWDQQALAGRLPGSRRLFQDDEISQLTAYCRDNLVALARGAVPTYYLPNGPDGSVHGISLTVHLQQRSEPIQIAQLSSRKPYPLQSSLFQMCETISNRMRTEGIVLQAAEQVHVDLAVLYDPALHGTAADPDLDGFDPQQRALLASHNGRSAWRYDPTLAPPQLLQQVVQAAQITLPEVTSLLSFVTQSNRHPVSVINVPRPMPGPAIRPPAVAGTFYPADASQLSQLVGQLMPSEPVTRQKYRAAMVPHAGLVFSGRLAADVLRRIEFPPTVIVLGPKHTSQGVEWAVAPHQTWSLPGLEVGSDPQLAAELCQAIEGLQLDALAHQREHAIEVELPLLAKLAPQSRVVGVAIGAGNWPQCQQFAAGLAQFLRPRLEQTLLLISSDMNHFASDAETRRVDAMALQALQTRDPAQVFHTVRDNHISMCGVLPAVIVLETLRQLDALQSAELVGYATSADVSGDTRRVVGYAGMLFR